MKNKSVFLTLFIMFLVLGYYGCNKSDSITENQQMEVAATNDAAVAIANSMASDNGGTFDQVSDALLISSPIGLNSDNKIQFNNFGTGSQNVTRIYDSTTGWWTVTINKQRGTPGSLYYASFSRVYKHQFLNKNGQFQKFYIVDNNGTPDTAYTVNHTIVSGSGVLKNPRVSNNMYNLGGEWVITNANQQNVTINSVTGKPYTKSNSDTLTRLESQRTLNSTISLNFNNVVGPRGTGLNWHNKISGTITGHYHAVVTFQKGEVYREKVIDRDINIVLGQAADATLDLNGSKFKMNIQTGEITN